MKSILISIKPRFVADILNLRKTIEVRKTAPKCDLPIDVYIYCTKTIKPSSDYDWGEFTFDDLPKLGKVVAKFTLRKVDTIYSLYPDPAYWGYGRDANKLLKRSCLSDAELTCYLGFSNGYAWHISDLEIFDEPKELNGKAPQSWQYIEVEGF